MRIFRMALSAIVAVAFFGSGMMVVAQSDAVSLLQKYNPLVTRYGEYYVFMDDRRQVVDYAESRLTRVCTSASRHQVPLAVTADDQRIELAARECVLVEGKSVYLEPAKPLDPKTMIKVDVAVLASLP